MLKEIQDHYEVPGLKLWYRAGWDQVTGSIQATHSNHKETRRYHFVCDWPDGKTIRVTSLTVSGEGEDKWNTEIKGIGLNKRADLHVQVRRVAAKWREEKIKEQEQIGNRLRLPDVAKITVTQEKWLMNLGETAVYYWADDCLITKVHHELPEGFPEWWKVIEIGSVDLETAEYIAKLIFEMGEDDLAIEAARNGLDLATIKAIVSAQEDSDSGREMMANIIGAANAGRWEGA